MVTPFLTREKPSQTAQELVISIPVHQLLDYLRSISQQSSGLQYSRWLLTLVLTSLLGCNISQTSKRSMALFNGWSHSPRRSTINGLLWCFMVQKLNRQKDATFSRVPLLLGVRFHGRDIPSHSRSDTNMVSDPVSATCGTCRSAHISIECIMLLSFSGRFLHRIGR